MSKNCAQIAPCTNIQKTYSSHQGEVMYFKDIFYITIPGKSINGRPVLPIEIYLQVEQTFQENDPRPCSITKTFVPKSKVYQPPVWLHANDDV